jgi:hypothetical protein
MTIAARATSIARRLLPVLGWLPTYRREWLLPDFLAGLAVWAVRYRRAWRSASSACRPSRDSTPSSAVDCLRAPRHLAPARRRAGHTGLIPR